MLTMHPEDKRGRGAAFEQGEKVLTMHPEDKRGRGAAFEQGEKVLTIPEPFRSIKKVYSLMAGQILSCHYFVPGSAKLYVIRNQIQPFLMQAFYFGRFSENMLFSTLQTISF